MAASDTVRNAARLVALHGETMTLARVAEGSAVVLKGKRIAGAVEEGGGSATQQRFRVRIGTAELLASAWAVKAPSSSTDTLTVGGVARTVMDVRPLGAAGTVALYELEVVG